MSDDLVKRLREDAAMGYMICGRAADRIEADAKRIAELESRHANDCEEIAKWREIVSGRTISENFEVVWKERLKRSEARAEAAESRVKVLEGLLKEARTDLEHYVDNDWPEKERAAYPSCQRKYKRDMELCYRIDAALEGEK